MYRACRKSDKRSLIITGPCGVRKTWLGCTLAQAAYRDWITVAQP